MVSEAAQPFAPSSAATARASGLRARVRTGDPSLRVAVVGLGRSGRAALAALRARGLSPVVLDDRPSEGAVSITAAAVDRAELVVLSPGVPRARPELAAAVAEGRLVGEVELALWLSDRRPRLVVTGTNGKSTTTALLGHILEGAGREPFVGGNLGRPSCELAASAERGPVVLELSSYQLESLVLAELDVAAWLNLTPDHTDRYASVETYALAKRRALEQLVPSGVGVLNLADPVCVAASGAAPSVRWFAPDGCALDGRPGTELVDGRAVRRDPDGDEVYRLDNPRLPGAHNRANMLAAIELARAVGLSPPEVQAGLASFGGLPHRIELVAEAGGVSWYNDSKATNVESTRTALLAIERPTILIAGGKDKGAPWTPLRAVAEAGGRLRAVLGIGEAGPIAVEAFRGVAAEVRELGTLSAAVDWAAAHARPGEAVLLSPACASFDQFDHYEHRGDVFRALARAAAEGGKR